jgi:alanine racemase
MNTKRPKGLRTWIEIDKKAIANNYNVFRGLIKKETKLMAVIKSNAYGHSLLDFAREVESLGADYLGVDSATEALALRKNGTKTPMLILGYTLPELVKEVADNDISFTVSSFDQLKELESVKSEKICRIHVKVDTGMCRQGFLEEDMNALTKRLKEAEKDFNVKVEGLFTHFASAKNPSFPQFTKDQINLFEKWIKVFKDNNFDVIRHASATAGAILFKEADYDMVRIGIGLYGMWPSKETKLFAKDRLKLVPILSWKTLISEVKEIKVGSKIGYDSTEIAYSKMKIAICPIGYWHGYSRAFSSIGRVLVKGEEARVLGRVSMDMIVIDVTKIKGVEIEDEVVIIGKSDDAELKAEDVSQMIDMSYYEFVTRINPLIKRLYI